LRIFTKNLLIFTNYCGNTRSIAMFESKACCACIDATLWHDDVI